jgi:hypothetical protein
MLCLFLLIVGDCVSTYFCLTTASDEYQVWEFNPISDWMFQAWGLIPGLLVFVLVKGLGLIYLYKRASVSILRHKIVCVFIVGAILITGYVNYNNWSIYALLKS